MRIAEAIFRGILKPFEVRKHPAPTYPADHQPGMEVTKGGSMCANCKFLADAEKRICGEPNFIAWNGSEIIPAAIDRYCSNWWKPKEA